MFLHDWKEGKKEQMMNDFQISKEDLKGVKILLASYTYEDYNGEAFVLFEQKGKLFEVNGGHCSCYGLEGQWEPEETSVEALIHRVENGHLGNRDGYQFADELKRVLKRYKKK